MSNPTVINKAVLLLTWGTGQSKAGKGKRAVGKVKAAVPPSKRRASVRVRSFVKMGGRFLKAGTVPILLPPSSGVIWAGMGGAGGVAVVSGRSAVSPAALGRAVAASVRRHRGKVEGGLAGRVRAGLAAAGDAGAARAVADSLERRGAAVVAYDSAMTQAAGDLGAWEDMTSAAAESARVTPAERQAARAAKRSARRVAGMVPRPVYCLPLIDGEFTAALAAERLAGMSDQAARAWVRRWEASGGREVDAALFEELAGIYHAAMGKAAACGVVPPDMRCLYAVGADGCGLSWRAWVAWRRALRLAGKACRSFMWGKGAEVCEIVSADELRRLAAAVNHDDESCERAEVQPSADDISADQRRGLRGSYVRRLTARWGDYLRAFHVLSGSREYRSRLAADLRFLACAARVARGEGVAAFVAAFPAYASAAGADGMTGAARSKKEDIQKRIEAGRVLATDGATCGAVDAVLEARRATRTKRGFTAAAFVVRVGDVVGPAQ